MKFIHYGNDSFKKELFKNVQNSIFPDRKPKVGGLWASPLNSEFGWKQWCNEQKFRDCEINNSFVFELKEGSNILIIDKKEDTKNMCPILEYYEDIKHYDILGYDFEKLSTKYDAVFKHLISFLFNFACCEV